MKKAKTLIGKGVSPALAILACWGLLTESEKYGMSFKMLQNIYAVSIHKSPKAEEILHLAFLRATSLTDFLWVYIRLSPDDPKKQNCFDQMIHRVKNFKQAKKVFTEISSDNPLSENLEKAIDLMSELVTSHSQALYVMNLARYDEQRDTLWKILENTASNFPKLYINFKTAVEQRRSKEREEAFSIILQKSSHFSDVKKFFAEHYTLFSMEETHNIMAIFNKKAKNFSQKLWVAMHTQSWDDWNDVKSSAKGLVKRTALWLSTKPGSEKETEAWKMLKETARLPKQRQYVWDSAHQGSKKIQAMELITELVA